MRRFTLKTMVLALLGLFGAHGVSLQAQTWTGSTPSDADSKTVYLYNVGADKFLGKGGRWGTEACLNYEGVPFTLSYSSSDKTFTLQSKVKEQGSSSTSTGYLTITDGVNSTHDSGNYFVDRNDKVNNKTVNNTFSFTAATTTTDGKNVYTLTITPTYSSSSAMYDTEYYMVGIEGLSEIGSAEALTNEAYGQWIIVTKDERLKAFESAEAANSKPVNATFLMSDFDFARNDGDVSNWKTGVDGTTSLSYYTSSLRLPSYAQGGTVKTYTHTYTSKHDAEYKSGSTVLDTYTNHEKSFTLTTLVPGDQMPKTITAYCGGDTKNSGRSSYTHSSEEVEFTLSSSTENESTADEYTYYVGNGYTDSDISKYKISDADGKDKEYSVDPFSGELNEAESNRQAAFGGNWTANIHGASGAVTQTLTSENMVRVGYYRVSCKGFTTSTTGTVRLWAASGNNGNGSGETITDQYAYTAIPTITEAPETYVAASQTLENGGQTYDASVRVYVENLSDLLKFGIYVDGADATAWTCFDNFAIEYLGNPTRELVLDEDQTDGKYIKDQATNDGDDLQAVKLYLHRSMNVNTWNSLVLPVSLTVGQVKSAFGDQVRISEFKGAIDEKRSETIIFSKISASRDNNNDTAIVAGRLYLVKPTKAMPTGQTSITVPGTESSITDYYSIVGVTYAKAAGVADKNYSDRVKDSIGYETFGSDTKVQFVGTYVKLTNEKIPAKSYVLNGNNVGGTAGLWYYRTKETASKGFRGWLQVLDGETSTSLNYEIDGVTEMVNGDTTGIGDIVDGNSNAINGNIYNLSGQLVRRNATSLDGLAAGIYVSGDKKYVVK